MRAAGWIVWALLAAACGPKLGTIGAMLGQSPNGTLTIRDAPQGLAASNAGLQPGDQILLIDGRDVRAMDAATLHQRLSGAVGEPVQLTILRGNEILRVTLRRTPAEKYDGN